MHLHFVSLFSCSVSVSIDIWFFILLVAASCDGRLPTLVAIRCISLHIIVLRCVTWSINSFSLSWVIGSVCWLATGQQALWLKIRAKPGGDWRQLAPRLSRWNSNLRLVSMSWGRPVERRLLKHWFHNSLLKRWWEYPLVHRCVCTYARWGPQAVATVASPATSGPGRVSSASLVLCWWPLWPRQQCLLSSNTHTRRHYWIISWSLDHSYESVTVYLSMNSIL